MRLLVSGILLGLTTVACSDGPSSSIAGPSSAAANNVVAVNVTAEPGPAPVYLYAMAQMSNGRTQDVTASARWESLNPSVATVSSGGMITAYSAGSVMFRATYHDVSGTVRTDVSPAVDIKRLAVTGTVSAATKPYQVVAGALVEVIAGPSVGQSVVAAGDGSYSFSNMIAGQTQLRVSKPGYATWTSKDFYLGANASFNVQLVPDSAE